LTLFQDDRLASTAAFMPMFCDALCGATFKTLAIPRYGTPQLSHGFN